MSFVANICCILLDVCVGTPLKFTGSLNTSRMNSVSKPMFDLESSLAQPLTWTPHKGKLKPIGTPYKKHEDSSVKPSANVSRMDVFKSAVNKTRVTYSRCSIVQLHLYYELCKLLRSNFVLHFLGFI